MKQNTLRLVEPYAAPVATELEVAIAEYLIAARQIGRSPATLGKYGWHLKRLSAWLE